MPRKTKTATADKTALPRIPAEVLEQLIPGPVTPIEWSPLIEQLVAETKTVKRRVGSLFLFPTLDGTSYTDSGFKCLWNRFMHSYVKAGGIWFHAHDLRAMYVSLMLGKGQIPNMHQNEERMRRVYDRRGEIKITPLG